MVSAAGPAAKKLLLAALRPKIEPALQRRGLSWAEARPAFDLVNDIEELQNALTEPEQFLKRLLAVAGPVARKLLLYKLRPVIEPVLKKHGLDWSDAVPIFELLDTIEELHAALAAPAEFLRRFAAASTGPAFKIAVAKLKPKLEPVVAKQGLAWADVQPALELIGTVEELQAAVSDPEAFIKVVLAASGPAAKKLLMAKLRPVLEPILERSGLRWRDVIPVIDAVDTMEQLEQAIDTPQVFFETVVASASGPAKRVLIPKLRSALEPTLAHHHLRWEMVAPALVLVDTIAELQEALTDPPGFLQNLLKSAGPAAKRLLIEMVQPAVQPLLAEQNLVWADVEPTVDLVMSVASLQLVLDNPSAFLSELARAAAGPAKKVAIAKLREAVRPQLSSRGIAWEDFAAVCESIDSVEEIQSIAKSPEEFLIRRLAETTAIAKGLAIAQLRPRVAPLIAKRGIRWEQMLSAFELLEVTPDTMEKLRNAMENPNGFLAELADGCSGPSVEVQLRELKQQVVRLQKAAEKAEKKAADGGQPSGADLIKKLKGSFGAAVAGSAPESVLYKALVVASFAYFAMTSVPQIQDFFDNRIEIIGKTNENITMTVPEAWVCMSIASLSLQDSMTESLYTAAQSMIFNCSSPMGLQYCKLNSMDRTLRFLPGLRSDGFIESPEKCGGCKICKYFSYKVAAKRFCWVLIY